jgi:hypothetical protein
MATFASILGPSTAALPFVACQAHVLRRHMFLSEVQPGFKQFDQKLKLLGAWHGGFDVSGED